MPFPAYSRHMHDTHQEFFDKLAHEWDLWFTAEDLERLTRVVNRLQIVAGSDILDLGCGTGILFDMLRRKVGDKGSVTGVDFSLKMADRAHRNFPFENVNVVDADVIGLPFRDRCFDMAIAFSSFPHFSDRHKALMEIRRVLKVGSPLHVIHLMSSREISEMHHRVGGVVAHDSLPNGDEMTKLLTQAGFVHVKVEDKPGLYLASGVNPK
ncbi:ubiquinone biosynthesis protein UbiE [candidate division GN15 bacterium]|uniref:Ubiquinone biosynthesis protein UbiE n=1 Tax=candidate division GN15 bacterium TaxID=2072418 RepID=A0A855X3F1_9BACT|nr:MAG: ubiquinone biosynthesis protein UbiE [candidate division GN15 bacterium]